MHISIAKQISLGIEITNKVFNKLFPPGALPARQHPDLPPRASVRRAPQAAGAGPLAQHHWEYPSGGVREPGETNVTETGVRFFLVQTSSNLTTLKLG